MIMKRSMLILISLGLVCITMLGACGSMDGEQPSSGSASIQVIDGLGREITLESPARRIVSLAASTTEMLNEIDALEWLIGRDEFSDEPPSVLDLPDVGGGWGDLNNELILTLEPDLVLAAQIHTPEQVQALEDLGLTVFWFPNFLSFDGLYTNLENLGKLTGREAIAQDRIAMLRERVEAVEALMADVEPVATYYEVDGSDPNAPWTTGSETFQDVLITMAGGVNIASEIQGWGQISPEAILAADPEVILFASGPFVSSTVESIASRAGWGEITAVMDGAIYAVDTNIIDRPGPRQVLALEIFAEYIHPELFE
ncbi:MAG TPA: ABC transporter substrate-binding protein [Anaerolineae bacterium]|nr:ABC transporter substrate-binding protein [Anaerolineae bacterium]